MSAAEVAVRIAAGAAVLDGDLVVPEVPSGLVIFAHGSGSSRLSRRNRYVAGELTRRGLATLLMDLLTTEEEKRDLMDASLRFDIGLLGERVAAALDWAADDARTAGLRVGLFGASTGAGAALVAAADKPDAVAAVVSRGGRPDLAGDALRRVVAPTLLIVGSLDVQVLELNRDAAAQLRSPTRLDVVPGASHLFGEPGTLERVADLAGEFFVEHLAA